ncbi:ABC transporter ATP-binding protein [Rhodoplanes sp. SY1]|uniref:ABC transporter ATP-binding protein n=1 Tax=Rhodoplanes sp. SY1 TaxID=3166646 RepID=UPI0038B50948
MSLPVTITGLSHRYGRRVVLDDIDLAVAAGERVALLGASGAGKSTLMQMIAGLAKPTEGTVTIGGRPVDGPLPGVTMMLQRPALLPWASVRQNVELGLRFSGLMRRDQDAARLRVGALLAQIGLSDRADALPTELSGGQQQRVALARALAPRPDVLLLDEPFSALDMGTRAALRADVLRLALDAGTTLILVSHDLADAEALCTRAVLLSGHPGRVAEDLAIENGIDATTRDRVVARLDAA